MVLLSLHVLSAAQIAALLEAAAVAELASSRADLLAEVAGIFESASEGGYDEQLPVHRGPVPWGATGEGQPVPPGMVISVTVRVEIA
jgi:hypothetical protein